MEYNPLPHGASIRLLEIQDGNLGDELVCKTIDALADRTEGIPYSALSYTWGEYGPKKNIIHVNGCEFHATENLHSALQRIRKSDQVIYVWVDAICINQDDEEEKGHQVKQMAAIYANAEEVLIWLGESDDDIEWLMDLVSFVAKFRVRLPPTEKDWHLLHSGMSAKISMSHDYRLRTTKQEFGLHGILNRPWFHRAWILQEVAMARAAKIMCGKWICAAQVFAMMPALLQVHIRPHAKAVLDIMPQHRASSWWASDRSLRALLSKYATSESTLPRDKIYALLGLSDDACDPDRFYPCYRKSDDDVFRDTASFLVFREILGPNYLLPKLTITELGSPKAELVYMVLMWLLSRDGGHVQRTIALLVSHFNERKFTEEDTRSLTQKLFQSRQSIERSQMPVKINVEFRENEHVLHLDLLDFRSEEVHKRFIHFPRVDGNSCSIPLKSPFRDDESPSVGIQRLVDIGASKEELLRAYVWIGDRNGALSMMGAGVDMSTNYSDGRTARDLLALV